MNKKAQKGGIYMRKNALEMINDIDDEMLLSAIKKTEKKKNVLRFGKLRWTAVAAAIALLVSVPVVAETLRLETEYNSEEEKWGRWKTQTNSDQKNEGSLDVYTRNDKMPSDFWGNPQPGEYIDEHVTQSNVNAWFDQFGVWRSWREQIPYYNYFDDWRDPEGDISAGWYNELSKQCGGSYRVSQFNEYIRAEHFQDLARKVTTWS